MEKEPLRVLFLCTGNSARSQIGEALLRHMSRGQDRRLSAPAAGLASEIHPTGAPGRSRTSSAWTWRGSTRSRWKSSWASGFDYIITVCDRAAEVLPGTFPDDPEPDPLELRGPGSHRR